MMNRTILTVLASSLLLLGHLRAAGQTTAWKGTVNTSWSTAGNWTAGVPTASTDAIIGDANFTGANQPALSANSSCKSLTLGTGSKACTLKVGKNLTVSGSVMIGPNGTLSQSGGTLSLQGNWVNLGSYAGGPGPVVTFAGTAQTVTGPTPFRKLTINAGSTTVLNDNMTVAVQLTVSGALDPNENPGRVISGAGKLVVNSGGKLLVKAATFAGNYAMTGAKTLKAGSTVNYAATAVNQTINNTFAYDTLRVSGALTKSLPGNLPVLLSSLANSGNIYVDGGILDLGAFSANRGTTTAGGTLSVTNGGTLRIGGTNGMPRNFRTHALGVASTVEYAGGNQTVSLEFYGNLTLSTVTGAVVKTLPAAPLTLAGNLTGSAAGGSLVSFSAAAPMTVRGGLFLGSGATFNGGSFAHSVGGNWSNNGTFNGGAGTVSLSGAGAMISGPGANLFNDLVVTGAGITASSNTDIAVAGNFSTSGLGSFAQAGGSTGTLTISGSGKTISGNGITLNNLAVPGLVTTVSSLNVGGNLSVNGTFQGNGGTLSLSGPAATVSGAGAISFYGLNISGSLTTSRDFTVNYNLSVPGSFSASAGTITFAGNSLFSGAANLFNVSLTGSRLQLATGSWLGVSGALALSSGIFDASSALPNTVNYNGAAGQSILGATYGNLILSGSGTKTAGGALTISGDLTIGTGVTFAAGSFTHSLLGNWIKQGNFASGSGAIQLAGTQDAAINGATTFGTLTVNKTGVGNVITMSDNLGVGTLNILAGTLLTGTNELTITVDRTGPGIILGTITRTHAFSPGVAYAFEGPNNTILFSSLLDIGSITETVTLGPVRDFPFGGSINRQYLLNVSSGGPYSATLRLHYLDSGLNGNSESIMQLWSSFGGWAASGKTANDPINNWVEQSALTDLSGRWTLSDDANAARWTGALSSAWENPGNWTAAKGAPQIPPSTNDIVEIAGTSYLAQPTISTPVTVRSLSLGSAQAMTLTLAPGGSLNLSGNGGNVTAAWSNNVVHTINVGAQSLSTAGILALSDGTNGHAINLNIGSGTVQVGDDFSVSGGAQVGFTGPGRLQVGGDFLFNGGTLNSGTGTVEYNGQGPQIVAGGIAYNNLAFNKAGGAATLSTPATVLGDLVLSNASTLLMNATLTVSNNVVIGPGAILNGDASTLKVGGNWTRVGTFIPNLGTVEFNGPGQQTIQSTTFNNLSVNKLSGGATAAANLVLNGDLNLTSGVLDLFTNTITRGAFGGALNMGPGSVLRIGTGSSFPSDFATRAIDPASTVEFNGTGPQIVSDNGYGNLAFSNGGSNPKVLGGNVAVAGDLIINSGASLFGGTYALLVHGNWTNNGSFFPATGSVSLVGNGKNLAGPTTFNQLTVSGNYVATSDITVNNSAIISGSLAAGSTTDTFSGDFSCLGSFSNSGIVTFSVTGPQIINLGSGFASSGTLNFNGSVAPALVSQPLVLNNVNINNIGGIAPAADWTVDGDFVVSAGSTFDGGLGNDTFERSFNNNGTVLSGGTFTFVPATAVALNLGGASFSSSGTVIFGGGGQITLGNVLSLNSISIANTHPAGINPVSNWTLDGDLFIANGAILNGGNGLTLKVAGDFTDNGTFNGDGSVVELNGSSDIAGTGATTFNHLLISGAATASSDFNVTGNFANSGSFDGTGSTVTFIGSGPSTLGGLVSPTFFDSLHIAKTGAALNLAINLDALNDLTVASGTLDIANSTVGQNAAGGVLTVARGAALRIGGTNTLPAFSTDSFDPASTVEYYGTGTQVIAPASYGNLTSSSTGARVLPSGATNGIAGVFTPGSNAYTVTGSTVEFNGSGPQTIPAFNYNNLISSSSGDRALATNGTIAIAGIFTPGQNNYTVTNSTINFNGSAQTIPVFTYYNLSTSATGTKTLAGNLTVNGSLSVSGGTLADAGFTATVKGNAANSASHTGSGRLVLTQSSATHHLSGSGTYGNLELNDANGAVLDTTNLTVNGLLTFTKGLITTTTNVVIIGPTGAVARVEGYVAGNLRKPFTTGSARTNSFEIGDPSYYAPITCVFSNVTAAGSVTASTTPGDHPDLARSGILSYASVNRYWTLVSSNIVFGNYSAQFNFVPGDLDPAAAPANFRIAERTGGNWSLRVPTSVTSTNVKSSGLTVMGDFAVGALNTAPVLTVPGLQMVRGGATLVVTNTATDAETNALTFSLVSSPSGMTLDPVTGIVAWTAPLQSQSSTNTVTVAVTDNGQPPLSTTNSFSLIVAASADITSITPTNGTIVLKLTGFPGDSLWVTATPALNPPISWTVISTNVIGSDGFSVFIDADATNYPMRFYRVSKP